MKKGLHAIGEMAVLLAAVLLLTGLAAAQQPQPSPATTGKPTTQKPQPQTPPTGQSTPPKPTTSAPVATPTATPKPPGSDPANSQSTQKQNAPTPGNSRAAPQTQPPSAPANSLATTPEQETPGRPAGGWFEWRFTIKANHRASSNITARNICRKPQRFEIVMQDLPTFMLLQGEPGFLVPPGSQHLVPVQFDSTGLATGLHEGWVSIKCVTCRTEATCSQDFQRLHIYMTVEPAPAPRPRGFLRPAALIVFNFGQRAVQQVGRRRRRSKKDRGT